MATESNHVAMENMPILIFEPCRNLLEANTTYSYYDGEMITSTTNIK